MKQIEMRDIAQQAVDYASAKFPGVLIETFVQGALWATQEFILDLQSRLRELEDENAELNATQSAPPEDCAWQAKKPGNEHWDPCSKAVHDAIMEGSIAWLGYSARALVVQRERRGPPPAEFVRTINSNPAFEAPYAAQVIASAANSKVPDVALPPALRAKTFHACRDATRASRVQMLCRCGPEHKCSACSTQEKLVSTDTNDPTPVGCNRGNLCPWTDSDPSYCTRCGIRAEGSCQ